MWVIFRVVTFHLHLFQISTQFAFSQHCISAYLWFLNSGSLVHQERWNNGVMLFYMIIYIMYIANNSNHFCDVHESLESWQINFKLLFVFVWGKQLFSQYFNLANLCFYVDSCLLKNAFYVCVWHRHTVSHP